MKNLVKLNENSVYATFKFYFDNNSKLHFENLPEELKGLDNLILKVSKINSLPSQMNIHLNKELNKFEISIKISYDSNKENKFRTYIVEFHRHFGKNMLKTEKSLYQSVDFLLFQRSDNYEVDSLFGYDSDFQKEFEKIVLSKSSEIQIVNLEKTISDKGISIKISEPENLDGALRYKFEFHKELR